MYRFEIPFKVYLTLLFFLLIAQCVKAQVPQNGDKIKSQLIVKLINQLDWPADKEAIKIGVLGKNINFSKNLINQVSNSKKQVAIETDLRKCDIIYVPHEGMSQYTSFSHIKNSSLVITAAKSDASMYFEYDNGTMFLKVSNLNKVTKNNLPADFQLIAP